MASVACGIKTEQAWVLLDDVGLEETKKSNIRRYFDGSVLIPNWINSDTQKTLQLTISGEDLRRHHILNFSPPLCL